MVIEEIVLTQALKAISDFVEAQKIKDAQVTVVSKLPTRLSRTRIQKITTSATAKPSNATYELENPLNRSIKLKSLDIVFDDSFRTNGVLIVEIDGQTILDSQNAGDFADVKALEIKIDGGLPIRRDDSIKFYFWNDVNGDAVGITPIVRFGD